MFIKRVEPSQTIIHTMMGKVPVTIVDRSSDKFTEEELANVTRALQDMSSARRDAIGKTSDEFILNITKHRGHFLAITQLPSPVLKDQVTLTSSFSIHDLRKNLIDLLNAAVNWFPKKD